jgi:outer membrane protein
MNRISPFILLLFFVLLSAGKLEGFDLLECYLKAKQHDPQYLSVYHEFRAQQTLPKQSRSLLLPQVQASYGSTKYDFTDAPDTYKDYWGDRFSVSLRQTIYSRAKSIDLDQNKLRALSGELKLLDTKNGLMVRVSEAYFKHLYAIAYLKVLLEEEKATAENLKMIGLLSDAGETTLADVHDAEARKAEVDFRIVDSRNQAEITKYELERLVGEDIDSIASLSEDIAIVGPSPENIDHWIGGVRERNPVVRYYALASDIMKDELKKQKAQHLPTVDLVGFYNRTNTNDYVKTSTTTYYAGGVQISMPLWTSGNMSYKTEEFREKHAQAVKDYERALSDAIQSLRNSFLGVHSSISKAKSAQAYLNASQTALTSTKIGYQSGVRTIVDLLNATSSLYKAKGDLLQVRIDYVMQKLRLLYWNGGIDESSISEINGYLTGKE